jgi:glycosyltransferase involved in cell wall biosynthesis
MDKQPFYAPSISDLSEKDKSHIELTYITHFYLNNNKSNPLENILNTYSAYSRPLLQKIQFVIVDDGSPIEYTPVFNNLNITWIKIDQDIPWNQPGARNLGVVYAKSDKIFLTDGDFIIPEHTLTHLVSRKNPGKKFYKVPILHKDRNQIGNGHPNMFFMSRARFFRFYGYDEDFSGGHGGDDYRFVKFQKYHGSWQRHLGKKYYCERPPEMDTKKGYHNLSRDSSRDNRKRN